MFIVLLNVCFLLYYICTVGCITNLSCLSFRELQDGQMVLQVHAGEKTTPLLLEVHQVLKWNKKHQHHISHTFSHLNPQTGNIAFKYIKVQLKAFAFNMGTPSGTETASLAGRADETGSYLCEDGAQRHWVQSVVHLPQLLTHVHQLKAQCSSPISMWSTECCTQGWIF